VKSPENPNFWGREQAFSSQTGEILKVSCYRNYCIDFNQILRDGLTDVYKIWYGGAK